MIIVVGYLILLSSNYECLISSVEWRTAGTYTLNKSTTNYKKFLIKVSNYGKLLNYFCMHFQFFNNTPLHIPINNGSNGFGYIGFYLLNNNLVITENTNPSGFSIQVVNGFSQY